MFGIARKGRKRIERQRNRYAKVDGIPFLLPVNSDDSPALMAAFPIDFDAAAKLMPGNELHPFKLWNGKSLLVITVIDYRKTDIGKYIEYSVAIACTHGPKPAPRMLPGIMMKYFGTGQFVLDLPVSTEISVKGGKGIWGMPKHQASLNFVDTETEVSSQYELDGKLVLKVGIKKPKKAWFPLKIGAANYCQFRGMLMKSYVFFKTKLGFHLFNQAQAEITIGDHPRLQCLHSLNIDKQPLFTAYLPKFEGLLDDYFESWFITYKDIPEATPEGLESVVNLSLDETWPEAPKVKVG